jgi:hypothetical protein
MEEYIKIDGGLGRCISATGVIEEYAKNSENKINIVTGYTNIFEGLEGINRIYNFGTPYLYQDHIKHGLYKEPEPYNDINFYQNEEHITTIFNKLINGKKEFIQPKIVLTETEKQKAKQTIEELKKETKKTKIVLFQPFGRMGGHITQDKTNIPDETYRSLTPEFTKKLHDKLLKNNILPLYVKTPDQIAFENSKSFNTPNVREIIACIPYVDAIISVDSFLPHAVAGLNSPIKTIVFWAGTNPKQFSYKEHEQINTLKKVEYPPNRIPHDQTFYVQHNKNCNDFSEKIIHKIISKI